LERKKFNLKKSKVQIIKLTDLEKENILEAFPEGVVIFDLETTGLSALINNILEIGAIKVTPEGLTTFKTLVNPEVEIPASNTAIHGITGDMVKDSPKIKEVLPKFMNFVGDLPLVAHNAQFDLGFITYDLHMLGLPFGNSDVYCTIRLSRLVFKDFPSHRLGNLAKQLNIPLERAHRAEDDAFVCLKVLAQGFIKAAKNKKSILKGSYLFNLQDFKNMEKFVLKDFHKPILRAIENNDILRIKYLGGSKKNKFRPIRPVGLLPLPQGHVLYAHCLESNLYKFYYLNKITDCQQATEKDHKLWESLS